MKGAPATETPIDPSQLASGVVLWGRLRLLEKIPSSTDTPLWRARDLRTESEHAVELLSNEAYLRPADWRKNAASLIAPQHPALLSFYRFEGDQRLTGAVTAFDRRLNQPTLARKNAAAGDLGHVLRWMEELVHAIDEIHGARIRPHGAIIPSRVILSPGEIPLLTGYPYGAFQRFGGESVFLTEERQKGSVPTRGDDVFSLAILFHFLATGGALPTAQGTSLPGDAIDAVRARRNLPVSGWPEGWDRPIFNVIRATTSARPSNARAWFDEINRALNRERLRPARRETELPLGKSDDRPRRAPPWRNAGKPVGSSSSDDPAPLRTLAHIREETEELARQTEEIRQQKIELELQTAELASARTQIQASESLLVRQRSELQQKQAELEAKAKSVAEAELRVETLSKNVEQTSSELRLAQDSLRAETTALAQARAQVSLEVDNERNSNTKLAAERERLEKLKSDLAARGAEIEAQSRTLNELQPALVQVTGTNNPAQWRAFVQRIETGKIENERRSSALETERKRLEDFRQQLERRAATAATEPLAVQSAAEPPPPPPTEKTAESRALPNAEIAAAAATPTPPPPIAQENRKATIATNDGRRIHIFGTSVLRFGRHANSDVLLVAVLSGQAQPTMALNREISRKHFELQIAPDGIRVIDGWSDDGKPSQHGLCVDGRRVQSGGAPLKNGMLLSVTTRAPARAVPHWKVRVYYRGGDAEASALISALWLQRLDDAPEDVAVVLDSVPLQDLGIAEVPGDAVLVSEPSGLQIRVGPEIHPLVADSSPLPGLTVLSVGWCSPSIVVPSN